MVENGTTAAATAAASEAMALWLVRFVILGAPFHLVARSALYRHRHLAGGLFPESSRAQEPA